MTNVYIETYGCSHNQADSEQMAGLLKEAKFNIVDNIDDAYVVIINTCTVKTPTENNFYKRLKEVEALEDKKLIVIAGCIPQTDIKNIKKYPIIGTKQIHKVVEVVEEALNDNPLVYIDTHEMPPLDLPRVKKNSIVGIIPINRGCLGACSFCKTKAARGNLISYPIEEIKREMLRLLKDGTEEIWLTSQDTGCYGFDINTNLANLLNELLTISGDYKIRIGMMNPDHLLKFLPELIEIYKHSKVFKFLHLPVQSGNNKILTAMNRNYTIEQFKEIVSQFRKEIPEFTLATDIIVGFPGETEEQHWDTLTLLREVSPEATNISKFWKRPKTKAAEMKQVPTEVIKRRSQVITDISYNIARLQNEKWLGQETEMIVDEKSKEDNQWIGKNPSYKQVIIEGDFKLGQKLKVKIVKINAYDLRAELV